jgi:hypothetical protein
MSASMTENGISSVNSIDDNAVMVYNEAEICKKRVIV